MGKRVKFNCIYVLLGPDQVAYVGQTSDPVNRKSRYKTMTCKNQTAVYESLMKHGYNNHSFVIVHFLPDGASRKEMDFYETMYYEKYIGMGYKMLNLKSPGWNGKPCAESIERLRKSHIGQVAWNKGKKGVQKAWNKGLKKDDYAKR